MFEISWPHEITTGAFLRVWEDGEALTFASSVANCDATPGSCWYSGVASANNPLTVYVHPKGSTDPTVDGKEYSLSSRNFCIRLGTNNTVRGLFLDKSCGNDGPVSSSQLGGTIERCIIRWGTKHHSVLQVDDGYTVRFKDVIGYRQVPTDSQWGGGSNTFTVFRSAPSGGEVYYDGCVVYDPTLGLAASIFSHTGGSGTWMSRTMKTASSMAS